MVANNIGYENPRETERQHLTPVACGGYMVPLSGNFPRTDIDILMPPSGPMLIVVMADTDQDGRVDHRTVNELTFHDVDGDGVIERECDALRVRLRDVSVVQDQPYDFGADDVLAVARVVVVKLGGTPGDVVEPEDDGSDVGDRFDGLGNR